jgi:hypothetical protein
MADGVAEGVALPLGVAEGDGVAETVMDGVALALAVELAVLDTVFDGVALTVMDGVADTV